MNRETSVAVIDIGSNSVRLLLLCGGRARQEMETTRLGAGTAQRRLQPESMARTVEAVARFCAQARAAGAERVLAFATSAVRDAVNREELLRALRARCGLEVDVLSGAEEANLAYLGAAEGRRALVLDIGGGSTELVYGAGAVQRAVSLQAGAVRLKERFMQDRALSKSNSGSNSPESSLPILQMAIFMRRRLSHKTFIFKKISVCFRLWEETHEYSAKPNRFEPY